MIGILSLLTVLTLSIIINRIATMALMLTGLSRDSAKFQARSALTGVGFTTTESEALTNHPLRRRIIMILMLLGNLGIATFVATSIMSYMATSKSEHWILNVSLFVLGIIVLFLIASNKFIERKLNILIIFCFKKWTKIDIKDYIAILNLEKGFAVSELLINGGDWLVGKTLEESKLHREGVLVLGIKPFKGEYLGTPQPDTVMNIKDTLTVYGSISRLQELDQRRKGYKGENAHLEAVIAHKIEIEKEFKTENKEQ